MRTGTPDPDVAALTGYTVVHLHGAVTAAPFDGWTENVFAPGQHAVSDYPMDQRAALLWYHDHVMGVTRLTVYAGLAGRPPFEVPLPACAPRPSTSRTRRRSSRCSAAGRCGS